MIRGQQKPFNIDIEGIDLSDYTVTLKIKQGSYSKTYTPTITTTTEGCKLSITPTQNDTLGLSLGTAEFEVVWVGEDDYRDSTGKVRFIVEDTMFGEVMHA